ncbi:MAG: hypothetical protein M3548_10380 [Actinomycetota bacterium]|nr:hypothetical protein [Actinomycetota bacterium]
MAEVELSAVISQLRAELTAAIAEGEGEDLRFELGPVELELSVAIGREAGGSGKVKFWVVEAGADGKVSSTATQRVTLSLDPQRVSRPGQRPLISGAPVANED